MRALFLALISVGFGLAASAEKMDADSFRKLVEETVRLGKTTDVGDGMVFKSMEHKKTTDERGSHQDEYFSVIGYSLVDGRYVPSHISVVSENWTMKDDGHWGIDQWIFEASLENNMYRAHHIFMVQDRDGRVLDYGNVPHPGTESEEVQKLWNIKVDFWVNQVLGPAYR